MISLWRYRKQFKNYQKHQYNYCFLFLRNQTNKQTIHTGNRSQLARVVYGPFYYLSGASPKKRAKMINSVWILHAILQGIAAFLDIEK